MMTKEAMFSYPKGITTRTIYAKADDMIFLPTITRESWSTICNYFSFYHVDCFKIDKVIFNDPATIVFWKDGEKTVVKCQPGNTFSKEAGLALAFMKKVHSNKGNYNDLFREWIYNN